MKIVSFNINGLRARLEQLQSLINAHSPDIIGLQEIKVHDEVFPAAEIEAMGYTPFYHGQKAHYGVALLCKRQPDAIQRGFPGDEADAQRRMIIGRFTQSNGRPLTLLNGYFPQGENRDHETKFPAKQKFYADLQTYLESHHTPDEDLIVMGDLNISPEDLDIGIGEANRKRWLKEGKCSFLPEEREWLARLKGWGLVDTFRQLHPQSHDRFSWFDYRSKGFDDNRGLRIDLILATRPLLERLQESDIDYPLRGHEKPSDHAPIWASFS
ncbi:MAG: exodeoxyribonuclease III [Aeromonadaceae bacterium]|nr:exodeoxyribonuclease III [Aeromonadaceae bacterium]